MEGSAFWDIMKIIAGSALGIFITTIFPFILALRKEKSEKSNIESEAAHKIAQAAGTLQDAYMDLLAELKSKTSGYKEEIGDLLSRLRALEKSNDELKAKIDENTKLLAESKKQVEESRKIIEDLVNGIKLLTKQIEILNEKPMYKLKE